MTAPGGLLDFFALEAAEHLDRLDAVASGTGTPDADALHRHARALRGSATMAKVPVVAELAAALERVAKATRDGGAPWGAGQRSAIVSAVDELRKLVRLLKTLGPDDTARAGALAAELDAFVPRLTPRNSAAVAASSAAFVATEAKALEVALAMIASRPDDAAGVPSLADRVNRVRGVAALKEFPAVADVVEGIERVVRSAERGAGLTSTGHAVLRAAAEALRDAGLSLAAAEAPAAGTPAFLAFSAALDAFEGQAKDDDRIVPIAELFPADGLGVVDAASAPPTTPAQRFRLEAVSLAEHLRRCLADGTSAQGPVAQERAGRELRRAMRALELVATSFGEQHVARFVAAATEAAVQLEPSALASVGAAARLLSDPTSTASQIAEQLGGTAPVVAPPAVPPPATPAVVPPTSAPAATNGLQALLAQGLAGLGAIETTPLVAPVDIADATVVPIERLVYRGRAALARAQELRDRIKARGTAGTEELDELFDLLDLVATE
jgi:chemotaxis protein histidine kinase CheA